MNTATKIIVSIGSIAVIATAGIGGYLLATSNGTTSTTTPTSTSAPASSNSTSSSSTTSTSSSTTSSTSSYKDGTYTASSSYYVPHGTNTISATITVSNNKITSVTTKDDYTDRESAMYIDSFESSVSGSAVGTSLANASFSRIGGASLTTEAFNSVLDEVRTQAAA